MEFVLANSRRLLRHERTASGAKYSDGEVAVWNKGTEANLTLDGRTYECARDQ